MKKISFFKLKQFADSRGRLIPLEFNSKLPFKPKRIYAVFDVKGVRGGHVHLKEKEIFICIRGNFKAKLHDGKKWRKISFGSTDAVYIPNLIWHEFYNFSKDAVMLALSSTHYSSRKKGYIMDFDKFMKIS